MQQDNDNTKVAPPRPRILVLEGLSGAADCVYAAGAHSRIVSPWNLAALSSALEHAKDSPIHGLLLTGGGDVDPRLYGEKKPDKRVYGVSQTRDEVELVALEAARIAGWPVLGICRGAQMMAVEGGGRLRQHIEGHRSTGHRVEGLPGSVFHRAVGPVVDRVVSLHHQEVMKCPKGWAVSGLAHDGTVEAIESLDGRCLAVQFHPEMDEYERYSQRLFRWLVRTAAERAGLPVPSQRLAVLYRQPWNAKTAAKDAETWRRTETTKVKAKPRSKAKQPRGKRRAAGQLQLPLRASGAAAGYWPSGEPRRADRTVRQRWMCTHCAMVFDKLADRDAHVDILHETKDPVVAREKIHAYVEARRA